MRGLARSAALISITELVGKSLGIVRSIVVAALFGASAQLDAVVMALTVPSLMYGFLHKGFEGVMVPTLSRMESTHAEGEKRRVLWTSFHLTLLAAAVLTLVGLATAPLWLEVLLPGFTTEARREVLDLVPWVMPMLIFQAIASWAIGFLHFKRRFIAPALASSANNVAIIAVVTLLYSGQGAVALAIANLCAAAAQVLVLFPALFRACPRYEPVMDWKDPEIGAAAGAMVPVLLGFAAVQMNVVVDRAVASFLAAGSISALYFANRVMLLTRQLFGQPLITVLYPEMAQQDSGGGSGAMVELTRRGLVALSITVVPISLLLALLGARTVAVFFERGAFTPENSALTSEALFYYSFSIPFVMWRELLSRGCYVAGNQRLVWSNAVLVVSANIVLSVSLAPVMGLGGLALASSLSMALGFAALAWKFTRLYGAVFTHSTTTDFLKVLAAGAGMTLAVELAAAVLFTEPGGLIYRIVGLMVFGVGGGVVFGVLVWVLGVREVRSLSVSLRRG